MFRELHSGKYQAWSIPWTIFASIDHAILASSSARWIMNVDKWSVSSIQYCQTTHIQTCWMSDQTDQRNKYLYDVKTVHTWDIYPRQLSNSVHKPSARLFLLLTTAFLCKNDANFIKMYFKQACFWISLLLASRCCYDNNHRCFHFNGLFGLPIFKNTYIKHEIFKIIEKILAANNITFIFNVSTKYLRCWLNISRKFVIERELFAVL